MAVPLSVSVIIPTWNAGPGVVRLVEALRGQDVPPAEIVAVDSGSTDGTRERLRRAGVRVIETSPGSFNHGETRNLALRQASGELAALLVQDALPAGADLLRRLIAPFADPAVAGTFGRQQPWPEASNLARYALARWVAARAEPRVVGPLSRAALERMTPDQRLDACAFDNVCSCIRLSVWRHHPFPATPIAEDLHWAAAVLTAGYRIAYAPDAVVWHSHDRSVRYELQRTYLVHQQLQLVFGLSTVPTGAALLRSIAVTLPVHLRLALGEPRGRVRAAVRAAGLAVAMPLGQYLGARAARERRELLRVRGV